jgi:hypothetical protein
VCEQANAAIKRLKAHLAYMTPERFRQHLALFFVSRNADKVSWFDHVNFIQV